MHVRTVHRHPHPHTHPHTHSLTHSLAHPLTQCLTRTGNSFFFFFTQDFSVFRVSVVSSPALHFALWHLVFPCEYSSLASSTKCHGCVLILSKCLHVPGTVFRYYLIQCTCVLHRNPTRSKYHMYLLLDLSLWQVTVDCCAFNFVKCIRNWYFHKHIISDCQ